MTHVFTVGEPAPPSAVDVAAIPLGGGRAGVAEGGVQIVLRVDDPTQDTCEALQRGPVALGLREAPSGAAAVLVEVGAPGSPGHLAAEAAVDLPEGAAPPPPDVELALCDAGGVVRAVRRFRGFSAPAVG
ncbi:hypothetical protein RQM47_16385 [Rubrivirga sp. S365]|uniref:hypothetical protein n=1 Tax=Rubrivirga sp. S365 TaxID=3076080 RepID=UPI0028CA0C53|nr:hypothetical protein [Rubrivirga sp. S365]MDT7858228.1 hypothetical protein [Rubrivirga sp. S365]